MIIEMHSIITPKMAHVYKGKSGYTDFPHSHSKKMKT